VRTTLSPQDLHAKIKQIEVDLGRVPGRRYGPRALDLDILLYGREIVDDEKLVVPHISMLERGFVLRPLAEYVPCYFL
jgi:2-amino-4-hydroxy-6-hydroxymethyldihydropteridine diphosphokinase